MPTGYTAAIENDQSFEDFALGCARAFGACMHQRDDNSSDRPKLREEDTHHKAKLVEAYNELERLEKMSGDERIQYGEQLRKDKVDRTQEYFNKKVVLRAKYESMLAKVFGWNPPSPRHQELKNFMIEQIRNSIDFDCNTKYDMEELSRLAQVSPHSMYEQALKDAKWSYEYHNTQIIKAKVNFEESNEWIMQLYDSLGIKYE